MKIAYFILNNFDDDSRARLEVETLRSVGHEINIIATVGGTLESFCGCRIHRVAQYRWPSRKLRFIQYNARAAMIGAASGADAYHAVDLDTLFAAWAASRKGRGMLVYESRELYTELEALSGRNAVRGFWRWLERRLIGRAEKIITINNSIADELVRRYGIARPYIIRNTARRKTGIEPRNLRFQLQIPADHKIIVYQGVLRAGQGLPYLLEIMKRLSGVTLVLIGDGPLARDLRESSRRHSIDDRVKFTGKVPADELESYTIAGDAGALLMENVALNNWLALPQKLFQYLSAGLPQIVSRSPEIAAFVEEEETGIVLSMSDIDADAESVSNFLRNERSMRTARQNSIESSARNNWEVESERLIDIYRNMERR